MSKLSIKDCIKVHKRLKNTELECIKRQCFFIVFQFKKSRWKSKLLNEIRRILRLMKIWTLLTWQFENKLLQARGCRAGICCAVFCDWINNSRIHGNKRIARAVDTVRKTGLLWLLWPFTQCSGEDIWTSSRLFTRRSSVVISEACFKCCGERRWPAMMFRGTCTETVRIL